MAVNAESSGTDLVDALWGSIPIICELADADLRAGGGESVKKPPPCAFLAPRQGYLFLVMDHLREEFLPHVAQEQTLWLSWGDFPLPWQYPVSAWLDQIAIRKGVASIAKMLPLNLTAHFTRTAKAEESVQLLTDPRMGRLLVYERLKCSFMLRFSTNAALRQMREKKRQDYDDLFTAVKNNEPRSFAAARRRLEVTAMSFAAEGGGNRPATVPVMLHAVLRDGSTKTSICGVPSSKRSFGALLKELLPKDLDALTSEECYADDVLSEQRFGFVLVQGIAPLLSTPVDALYEAFACVDGMLHISIYMCPEQRP